MTTHLTTDELIAKVENGVTWLTEHYQDGFNQWFEAKILPGTKMPAVSEEKQQAYREWYSLRVYWQSLYELLEKRLEKEAAA